MLFLLDQIRMVPQSKPPHVVTVSVTLSHQIKDVPIILSFKVT